MNISAQTRWRLLIISLPSRSATPRMRIWRALKALGAAVLRDGVYLLPDSEAAQQALTAQARAVVGSGGAAHVLTLADVEPAQQRHFLALFDRGREYTRLTEDMHRLRTGAPPPPSCPRHENHAEVATQIRGHTRN